MNSLMGVSLGPLSIAISLLIGLVAIAITFYFGVRKPIRESFDELSGELKKNRFACHLLKVWES